MNRYSLPLFLGARLGRSCLGLVALAFLAFGVVAEKPQMTNALGWQTEHLASISNKIKKSASEKDRAEYVARRTWLRRWKPGRMPSAPTDSPDDSQLVKEPLLEELKMPVGVDPRVWPQMIAIQKHLLAVDNDDERKENLPITIALAGKLEKDLARHTSADSKQLTTSTGWALAYVRYRLARALAYRELPVVRKRWPISDPNRYEEQLSAAYQRLANQTSGSRPEFILLEDRMLRRAGEKGRALELLEANKQTIEPKWYLKKRRDLLKELGWEPAYQEAAAIYFAAGYRDETQ
jgi:hypothetical protein